VGYAEQPTSCRQKVELFSMQAKIKIFFV